MKQVFIGLNDNCELDIGVNNSSVKLNFILTSVNKKSSYKCYPQIFILYKASRRPGC